MNDPKTLNPKQEVCEAIDQRRQSIIGLGEFIMDSPELGFKEHRISKAVQQTFDEAGFFYEVGLALPESKRCSVGGSAVNIGPARSPSGSADMGRESAEHQLQ